MWGLMCIRCRCVDDKLIDSAWLQAPKVFGCATDSSVTPARPFVFRTYEFPPGKETARRAAGLALHAGSSKHRVWQAIRASSAAPYYLDDFSIADLRFQDGAITVNNPAVCGAPAYTGRLWCSWWCRICLLTCLPPSWTRPSSPCELVGHSVCLLCGSKELSKEQRSSDRWLMRP
jgi:hypothetical protein